MPVHTGDQPNTAAAIRFVQQNWGVQSFGFATSGHVANSCHYRGLALDAMTSNLVTGTAIAQWFIANPGAYGTTQVIWQRKIWTQGQGWHPYTGINPHTNHVHISLAPCGGNGAATGTTPISLPGGSLLPEPIPTITGIFRESSKIFGLLSNTQFWFRVLEVAIGAVLIFVGLTTFLRPAVKPIVEAVT